MEDDETRPRRRHSVSTEKMSKTPSWIMLGFVLGALFVLALPRSQKPSAPPPQPPRAEVPAPQPPPRPKPLTIIEDVFAVWGKHATWFDDVTEVALWNTPDKAFTDFYEVRRIGDALYFRTIPKLTRRIITHGTPLPDSPLQFTETEEQYRDWFEHGRSERVLDRIWQAAAPQVTPVPPKVETILPPLDPIQPAVAPSRP